MSQLARPIRDTPWDGWPIATEGAGGEPPDSSWTRPITTEDVGTLAAPLESLAEWLDGRPGSAHIKRPVGGDPSPSRTPEGRPVSNSPRVETPEEIECPECEQRIPIRFEICPHCEHELL